MSTEAKSKFQSDQQTKIPFLTKVLRADGAFALLSGLLLLVAAVPLAEMIELSEPLALSILGLVLIGYAGMLFFVAGRKFEQSGAKAAIVLNGLWVMVSYFGLLVGWFPVNLAGLWAIALVAEVVTIFAILEFIALRRVSKEVVG